MRGGVGAAINKFWPTKIGRVEAKNVPKLNKYRAESSTGRGGGYGIMSTGINKEESWIMKKVALELSHLWIQLKFGSKQNPVNL